MLRVDNSNITYSRHCAIRQQRQHISKKKQRCRILTKRKKMEGKKITFTFLYIFQCHDTACGCATAVAIATTSGIMFTSSSYITPPTRGGGRTTTTTAAEQDKESPPPPRPSTNRKKSRSSQLEMLSAMPRSDQILASIRRRRTTSTAVEVDDGSPQSPLLPHRLDNSPPQQAGDDESIVTTRSSRSRGSSSTSSSANHNNHNNDLTVSVSEEQQEADDDEESYKEQPQEEEEDNDEESTAEDEDDDEDDDEYEEKKEQSKAAMIPVNVIVPYKEFCWTMERCFKCPKCNKRRLEVSQETFGFATELYIDCQKCSYAIAVSPLNSMRSWKKTRNKDDHHHQQQQQPRQDNDEEDNEEDPPNNNTSTRRNSRFMDYAINYSASLLMQHLGMGLRGVTTMLAFLGIAAGVGNKDKWKKLQDEVGMTEEAVAGVVMDNNLKEEIKLTRKAAEEAYKTWLLTDAGRSASPQIQANKMNELLCIRVGHDNRLKVGLSIGMDGAWQKRSIGKGLYNSKPGHNYGVGGHTKKILSIVAYSKHCYTCDRAIKSGVEPPIHRCAKNFDCDKSSKAMEPLAAVDHCKNLAGKNEDDLQCYISQLITDDDSTTRANTRHSYRAMADRDFPGWTQKKDTAWPFKLNNKGSRVYLPDHGKLPLWVPEITSYLCDISHRVKVIGSAVYALNSATNPRRLKHGWNKYDSERIKFNAGYFFHQEENQQLAFEEFCIKAKCIYLHHFNDHCCCNKQWCRVLRSQQDPDYELPPAYKAEERFRDKTTPEGKIVFQAVVKALEGYLSPQSLRQVHHRFSTQKNESLNRKMTAVAPKDRHYGGTCALKDRVHLVCIQDSIGYEATLQRLFESLDLPVEWNTVLNEWAKRKDDTQQYMTGYWTKPSNKRKRAETRFETFKAGKEQDKKAKKEGTYYMSGIGAMDKI